MKNKKLNLNELRVKSFVTELENEKENTVKGGGPTDYTCGQWCPPTKDFDASWCVCD